MRGLTSMVRTALVAGLLVLSAAGPARAAESTPCPVCSKANSEQSTYSQKAGSALVRGATNTLLGWTELIRQPTDEVKSGGNVITGLAKGVGAGVTRTLEGAAEVLTFWMPKVNRGYPRFSRDCPVCMGKIKK